MAMTLTLSGDSSNLSADYFPPIDLEDASYSLALIEFLSWNDIPNIDEYNNRFYFEQKCHVKIEKGPISLGSIRAQNPGASHLTNDFFFDALKKAEIDPKVGLVKAKTLQLVGFEHIKIPVGSYELADIEKALNVKLSEYNAWVKICVNKNTMKCELKSSVPINFADDDSMGALFGFEKIVLEPANQPHFSKNIMNLSRVNAIRFQCNITGGAYYNSKSSHMIHEFYPEATPGSRLIESPKNLIYLPIVVPRVSFLNVRIVDQDNRQINFRGEPILIRLHIKKDAGVHQNCCSH